VGVFHYFQQERLRLFQHWNVFMIIVIIIVVVDIITTTIMDTPIRRV
jgi:hypothetical protein